LSDSKRLQRLKEQDWEGIILKLTAHAAYKVERLRWQTGKKDLPGGKQVKDLAMEAIKTVWTNERKWNPDKQPDLLKHLKSIVDSLVSHLVESVEHTQREIREVEEEGFDPADDLVNNPLDEVIAEEVLRTLRREVKGDEDSELVLYCIEEGMSKPSEISDTLRMPVDQVYKAKRKLGVILKRLQEEDNG
jgi:hypothetical protein